MGPYSADAFFARGNHEKFDAVLAMYHDQGLIPFKSLALGEGTNFTAGLPIIRTSPDHGTAFDIAGKNLADEFDIPFLGQIPIVQSIREGGDSGVPIMASDDELTKKAFLDFAGNAARGIAMRNANMAPTEIQEIK